MKNKCASWQDCLEMSYSLSVSKDLARSRSLLETSKERVIFFEKLKLSEDNARFVFEGYYSSSIEVIHALTLKNGFKVENHVCLGFYLKDVLKRDELFRIFDDARFKRNSIVYYGKKIDFEIITHSISKLKLLIKEVERILS